MLDAMKKGLTVQQTQDAINLLDKYGIRIGISLLFGTFGEIRGTDGEKKSVYENEDSIDRTIQFVKKNLDEGKNITLASMNLWTHYPETRAVKKLEQRGENDPERIDPEIFEGPIAKKGYPWNRFEDGQGHHPPHVTEELARYILEHGIQEIGEVLQGQDLYTNGEVYEKIRTGETPDFIDFNHASLTTPKLTEKQITFMKRENQPPESRKMLLEDEPFTETYEVARSHIADIFGLTKDINDDQIKHIVLAPNTTEATNTAFLIGLLGNPSRDKIEVVATDAENYSITSIFKSIKDRSNPHGRDDWSTFQDYGARTAKSDKYELKLDSIVHIAEIRDQAGDQDIIDKVNENTRFVIFSHVIRDNGRIVDAKEVCRKIREKNKDCWIIVDGAQAFGTIPQFNVEELGCDFYVGTPHKTLNSYPFGTMYMGDRAMQCLPQYFETFYADWFTQPVRRGMFAQSFKPTEKQQSDIEYSRRETLLSPFEIRSLTAQFDPKTNNKALTPDEEEKTQEGAILGKFEMQTLAESTKSQLEEIQQKRHELKQLAINGLETLVGIEIISPQDSNHSDFILSFRFPNQDNRQIVDKLWRLPRPITLSYIARSDLIRISFDQFNEEEEIEYLIDSLQEIIGKTETVREQI